MRPSQPPSDQQFDEWLLHPITKRLMRFLEVGIEEAKHDFVSGALTLQDGAWQTGMKQANVIGRCEMARTILDLEYQQLERIDEE
jgi:hypothetical protein